MGELMLTLNLRGKQKERVASSKAEDAQAEPLDEIVGGHLARESPVLA